MSGRATVYISFPTIDAANSPIADFIENFKFSCSKILKMPVHLKIKGVDFNAISSIKEKSLSDLYIVILSSQSNSDENYQQELNDICKIVDLSVENEINSSRIFKVLLSPNDELTQPEALKILLGYNFFEFSGRRKTIVQYDFAKMDSKIWARILDLVYDIKDTILAFADKKQNLQEHFVYLGNCSSDQHDSRDDIRRELQHFGFRVLPVRELPREQVQIEQKVLKDLAQCKLIIQIMGGNYGNISAEGKASIFEIENQVIREFVQINANKTRLIWIPSNLKLSDTKQELFISRIKREDSDLSTGLIEASLDEFKSIIADNANKGSKSNTNTNNSREVYLIAKTLANTDFIFKHASGAKISLLADNEENNRFSYQKHLKTLEEIDNILIFYDQPDIAWLKSKIGDAIKALGKGRNVPFKSIGLISSEKLKIDDITSWIPNIEYISAADSAGIIGFFNKTQE